ncbi:ketoacyl-ACP synthase III [Gammaproteobacteria bacterium]|nr:ketoacyl-ACP synthase III [Gammaproteobacteria bacterium]
MNISLDRISYQLASKKETLSNLKIDNPEWDIDSILSKTGVETRYISEKNETALSLCISAAKKLDFNPHDIGACIFVSQSPDYMLPTSACIAQEELGLDRDVAAFDINLGCSGFIYALSVAKGILSDIEKTNALLLCGDTYSKFIKKNDRTCRPIFSDAGSAVLLSKSNIKKTGPFNFGTDGRGFDKLIVRNRASKIENEFDDFIHMNGAEVLLFTMANVPNGVKALLKKAGLEFEDIDYFLFHQASTIVLDNIQRKLNIPEEKLPRNNRNIGNTVSATIPILMKDLEDEGKLKKGQKLLLFGFGVGYSYGGCILEY